MDAPLLNDVIIIFGLSIAIIFIFHRLHVPTIVGFLLTGMLAGPHGLAVINAVQEVNVLAEMGIILLLFAIGAELSLKDMWQIKKEVLIGGLLQVLLTLIVVFVILTKIGLNGGEAIFIGFLISLSSTAIVLKLLQERDEIDTPHGKTTLAILIFQDIIIVPMILVTPLLAGETANLGGSPLVIIGEGIGFVLLVIISAKWVVPHLLYQIARTRSRELFLLSIVFICFSVALLTSSLGLSLSLGAFLAGLIISESEYSQQALSNILPFRDIFMSLFFVSIGMLLDINYLFQQPGLFVLIALSVLALKASIAGFVTTLLGYPLRTTIMVGLALGQVGEFSFVLSVFGVEYGLLDANIYQFFLAVSILTMVSTSFIIAVSPRIADSILRLPLPERLTSGIPMPQLNGSTKKVRLKDHIIIIGFGINGRNVARAAMSAGIPYLIIEMNPETVRNEQANGELIHYGDATHEAVLQHANIRDARVMVIGISDPVATRRIVEVAHGLNPALHMIVRTRYLHEMKPLYDLGADEVIPQEFETSVEIFIRVLKKYLVPKDEVEKFITEVRADGYEMFRNLSKKPVNIDDLKLDLPDVEISTFRIAERSLIVGKTLAQIGLRKQYGVTLLAIRRNSQVLSNPHGDTNLCANDVLVILGGPDKIAEMSGLFSNKPEPTDPNTEV
ncbi:MAG: cation:proton antiporter [Methanosarcinaceae archaeon]|nr:cation:proton antiporter [Methanosarcinaceae archaeon]